MTQTEYATIEREIQVDATPEVVFDVITQPRHIKQWWNADTDLEPESGSTGELVWGDRSSDDAHIAPMTVVEADRPRLFSFRWLYSAGDTPTATNSTLVTFELTPAGEGTVLRLTEAGFREQGWEIAVLEQRYNDHCEGWDACINRLSGYIPQLASTP